MSDPLMFKILFGLAAGLTAWVSAILVSRRFATERASLVVREVASDARGDASVIIENVGSRAALAIHLLIDSQQRGYVDGLAAGEHRSLRIERWNDEITIHVVFVDASRHRRGFKRRLHGGDAPHLIEPVLPGRMKRIGQWLHLTEIS